MRLRRAVKNAVLRGPQTTPLFGVNMDWAELSAPIYATAADWAYLRRKRIKYVRMPVAWENLQTAVLNALNSTTLTNIKAALAGAAANGIGVIVDLHNYGGYANSTAWNNTVFGAGNSGIAASNVNFLGDGTLTTAHFTDLWTKLATALVGYPGLIGYGLMNEPSVNVVGTNLVDGPNYFGSDFANWTNGSGATITKLAPGTNPLGAGYGPAWTITNGPSTFGGFYQAHTYTATAITQSIYAKTASGTLDFNLQISGTPSLKTANTTWQRFSFTRTPSAGSEFFNVYINGGSAGDVLYVANMQLELGSAATTYQPTKWGSYAQAAIDAIRAVDPNTPIYVNGYDTRAHCFHQRNYELNMLTGGNIILEAHEYFDNAQGVTGGGLYSNTYSSFSIDTYTGVQSLQPFIDYCNEVGVKGCIGEIGVPDNTTDSNQYWLQVAKNAFAHLRKNNMPATAWFYGANTSGLIDDLNIAHVGNDQTRMKLMLSNP